MMNRLPIFFRWLIVSALVEWLIGRTLTRTAIFMPKPPPVIALYQALTLFGQLAFTVTGLLAVIAVIWIAWESRRTRRAAGLGVALPALVAVGTASLFIAPGGWLASGYQLLIISTVVIMGGQVWRREVEVRKKVAWSIPALALLTGGAYQALPAFYAALRWPGPPPLTKALFNIGELFVVLSPIGMWWAAGQFARRSQYAVWAALPGLAFTVAHFANPAMTAIIAIWSTGLTSYLPWPLYAVSLWLGSMLVISSLRRGDSVGWAMLLLAAGGYAPQLSTQALLGLVALWLLNDTLEPKPGAAPTHQIAAPLALTQAATGAAKQ